MTEQLAHDHHANAICCAYAHGTSIQQIAYRHGCSTTLVEAVLAGRAYGDVTGRGPQALPSIALHLARPPRAV